MFIYFHNKENVYYKKKGNGIPIVFLHGFMESSEIWNDVYELISNKYKVLLIDCPGHGKSLLSKKRETIYTMEEAADSIKTILEKENIKKAVFVGHSMGGYIALALSEKYPEIFLGLCLLHSTAESDTKEKRKKRFQSIKLAIDHYPLFVSSNISKLFNPEKLDFFQKKFIFLKKIAFSTTIHSVVSFLRGMSIRKDRRFLLKTTTFPKLYIIGMYDSILPYKKLREEAKQGYKSFYAEIPTGHIAPIEDPTKIVNILENFIRNNIVKNKTTDDHEFINHIP
ncbi:alpha/beta fold hydrolase [Blattabacterium cuenoti]|uniref:alpha/beta fold hydrolase n=1 Tax=Blattabacterium cuenoti TaxID=1653831 RepID=UPI00163B6E25|nr:alpha/beta fold hydrolase [Blattabacterium cuenoti]